MPLRSVDLDRVRALPLFVGVAESTFRNVTAGAFLQKFPQGTLLLMEGDAVDFLYVLLDGAVQLGGSWGDKDTVLAVLRPISTFILAAVVLDTEALMSAQTLERSDILMLSGEALRRSMREDAQLAVSVAEELSGCYNGVVRPLKNLKLRGGVERLASYLLAQRASQGGADKVVLPHEKRVLASLLGMTPESLSRAWTTLADYGAQVNGREVIIGRPRVLERLAKPDPLIDNLQPQSPVRAAEETPTQRPAASR